jgi:hypothetical protein
MTPKLSVPASLENLFDNPDAAQVGPPELLEHDLNRYFPELLKFESTAELAAAPVVEKIREDAEKVLNAVVVENSEPGAAATGVRGPGSTGSKEPSRYRSRF